MDENKKKKIEKIYIDKAKNLTRICLFISFVNLVTYIGLLTKNEMDFGIIFDFSSFVFLIISRIQQGRYKLQSARRALNVSIISFGWIFIYDILVAIICIINNESLDDLFWAWYDNIFIIVGYAVNLMAVKSCLDKADNPEKYKESTDWFYESFENEEK